MTDNKETDIKQKTTSRATFIVSKKTRKGNATVKTNGEEKEKRV